MKMKFLHVLVSSGFPLPITEIMATLSSELTTANPQPKASKHVLQLKFLFTVHPEAF